jgi:hypothetical protein
MVRAGAEALAMARAITRAMALARFGAMVRTMVRAKARAMVQMGKGGNVVIFHYILRSYRVKAILKNLDDKLKMERRHVLPSGDKNRFH